MGTIAIVINPNSGRDIRRLTTHATIFDNNEKANILRRMIAGILEMGRHDVVIIPDRSRLARRALDGVDTEKAKQYVHIMDMPILDSQDDTTHFVRYMAGAGGADVMIVMGGDGTSRAAAKTIGAVPLIPVSTGTNNVYPHMLEGTAVAMAAAAIARGLPDMDQWAPKGKRIEIEREDGRSDIALIDAVFSTRAYVGARALLDQQEISEVLVTQCHPANIGFSALAGSVETIKPQDDVSLYLKLNWQRQDYIAALSAGVLSRFGVDIKKRVALCEKLYFRPDYAGTVAVDGEREMTFRAGEGFAMSLSRGGPRKVDIFKTLELAASLGYFGAST